MNEDEIAALLAGVDDADDENDDGAGEGRFTFDGASSGTRTAICRLCEQSVAVAELKHHLVLCTAAHSCHNNLRKLDGALKQCASRIARRHARMKTFSRIEALVTPLGTVRKYAEMAAASLGARSLSRCARRTN